jgi:hypothetical protein
MSPGTGLPGRATAVLLFRLGGPQTPVTRKGRVVAGIGAVAAHPRTDARDDYPVNLEAIRQDLPYAQRAVVIHQSEDRPAGQFCRNCHARYPCRLARWGVVVLHVAGWTNKRIAQFAEQAEAGGVTWT